MDCIFCKIIAGEIPGDFVYRDERVVAFRDINPEAPVHLLLVPVEHIASLNDLTEKDTPLMGHIIEVACKLAKEQGVDEKGYRLVINCGPEGGQQVPHIHLHLLGGKRLPMGLG